MDLQKISKSSLMGVLGLALVFAIALGKDCELREPAWDCRDSSSQIVLKFEEVTVKSCGHFNEKTKFADTPNVTYSGAVNEEEYVVFMVDPDAPGHPRGKAWLHWIVEGIDGETLKGDGFLQGNVTEYNPPTPPQGQNHRYVILIYRQPNPAAQLLPVKKRRQFDLHEYAKSHGLCGPVVWTNFITVY